MAGNLQNVVPVTLFAGIVGSSGSIITLDPNYDHEITRIFASPGGLGQKFSLWLADENDFWIFRADFNDPSSNGYPLVEGGRGTVLQNQSKLQAYTNTGAGFLHVSANRLAPSASYIFSH